MKDEYIMQHYCHDGSLVKYFYKDGRKWVSQTKWKTRYALYESGSWIDAQTFNKM